MGTRLNTLEKHNAWFLMHRNGLSPEEIAKDQKVTIKDVKRAISAVMAYRNQCTIPELEHSQVEMLLHLQQFEMKVIKSALQATKYLEQPDSDPSKPPKLIEVEDIQTRLEAVRIINEKIQAIRPRGNPSMTSVNVGVGVKVDNKTAASMTTAGSSFEDAIRKLNRSRMDQRQLEAGDNSIDAPVLNAEDIDGLSRP